MKNAPQWWGRELGKPYLKAFPEGMLVFVRIRKSSENIVFVEGLGEERYVVVGCDGRMACQECTKVVTHTFCTAI